MKTKTILLGAAAIALLAAAASAQPIGEGLVMYMQMGGNPGDGATLARQTGAAQAAEALGVDLKEQSLTIEGVVVGVLRQGKTKGMFQ